MRISLRLKKIVFFLDKLLKPISVRQFLLVSNLVKTMHFSASRFSF